MQITKEPVKFEKTSAHITYKLKDGTRVPGASTIAKIGDDPSALLYWAWDLGKQGIDYKKAREQAADIGTLAHFLIQTHLRGQEADLSEFSKADQDKAETAFLKFLEFWDAEKFSPVAIETPLVSEQWRYGGTVDLLARDDKGLALLDWKTAKAIYRTYCIQLAMYEQLWNENHPKDTIKRRAIIRVGKEDAMDLEVRWLSDLGPYFEAAKAQLTLYRAFQALPKT
jgi:PD-(D/E)XK nuclease superfamily